MDSIHTILADDALSYTIPSILMGGMGALSTVVYHLYSKMNVDRDKCDQALAKEREDCDNKMCLLESKMDAKVSSLDSEIKKLYKEFYQHKEEK